MSPNSVDDGGGVVVVGRDKRGERGKEDVWFCSSFSFFRPSALYMCGLILRFQTVISGDLCDRR